VSTKFLRKMVQRLRAQALGDAVDQADDLLERLRQDPGLIMRAAGLVPDPWQERLLRSRSPRVLTMTTRQGGKSSTVAAVALAEALLKPGSLTLLLSPSERQSGELAQKMFGYYDALGQPVPARKRTELQLHLQNKSRIIALPENERTIRGYSGASLLILDEASRIGDDLLVAVRPMLSVSRGRLLALSTPFAQQGWFFTAWTEGGDLWERIKVPASEVSRIDPSFLEEELRTLGPRWFNCEYNCGFLPLIGSVFDPDDIDAAFAAGVGLPAVPLE
jgi:hypothetical protein